LGWRSAWQEARSARCRSWCAAGECITCHPGDNRLAEVAITGVEFTPKHFAGNFTVPETGCASQWLRLVGTSAEFPKTQQVKIKGLQISRVGQR